MLRKLVLAAIMLLGCYSLGFAEFYENKEAGFKIIPPAGWHTKEYTDSQIRMKQAQFSLLPPEPIVKENVLISITVYLEPKSFNLLQPFNSKEFGGFKGLMYHCQDTLRKQQSMPDVEVTVIQEPAAVEINRAKGVWFAFERFSTKSPLKRIAKMTEYQFLNKGKWITILCVAGKDEYLAQEKEITAAINSLNFN